MFTTGWQKESTESDRFIIQPLMKKPNSLAKILGIATGLMVLGQKLVPKMNQELWASILQTLFICIIQPELRRSLSANILI